MLLFAGHHEALPHLQRRPLEHSAVGGAWRGQAPHIIPAHPVADRWRRVPCLQQRHDHWSEPLELAQHVRQPERAGKLASNCKNRLQSRPHCCAGKDPAMLLQFERFSTSFANAQVPMLGSY